MDPFRLLGVYALIVGIVVLAQSKYTQKQRLPTHSPDPCDFQICDYRERPPRRATTWTQHDEPRAAMFAHVDLLDAEIAEERRCSPYVLNAHRLVDRAYYVDSAMESQRDWWDSSAAEEGVSFPGILDLTYMINTFIYEERDYLLAGMPRSIDIPHKYADALWYLRYDLAARGYHSSVEQWTDLRVTIKIPDCVLLAPCVVNLSDARRQEPCVVKLSDE